MKKIFLTSLFSVFITTFSQAQWITSNNNLLYSNGNVAIGTANFSSALTVTAPLLPSSATTHAATNFAAGTFSVLGNTAGSYLYPFEFQHTNTGNIDRLLFSPYRRVAGATWPGTGYRIQMAVDNSFTNGEKAYVEIAAADPNNSGGGFISLGTEGQDRLVVTSLGNVGIGAIDTKGYKLAVAGSAIATSVTVKMQGLWPDYVFEESYRPQSLEELELYVKQNKHLPEIPTATEVKNDGLDLGKINAQLLKKIEELTIILIDQNKRLKVLEKNTKSNQ